MNVREILIGVLLIASATVSVAGAASGAPNALGNGDKASSEIQQSSGDRIMMKGPFGGPE